MLVIRSLIFLLLQIIITPVFAMFALMSFPLARLTRYRIISQWAKMMLPILRVVCGIRHEVRGIENLPKQPCIVMCKHQSAWETIALQAIFPPQIWVMKRELLLIPFLGWAFIALSAIPINRSSGRDALRQLVTHGKDRLARGLWVVIFPEGTRIAPGERGKYHIGGAWLATHTGTQVVPVAHNAGYFWRKNAFIKTSGTISVSIGKPIQSVSLKPDALNKLVENWIEAEILTLGRPT